MQWNYYHATQFAMHIILMYSNVCSVVDLFINTCKLCNMYFLRYVYLRFVMRKKHNNMGTVSSTSSWKLLG